MADTAAPDQALNDTICDLLARIAGKHGQTLEAEEIEITIDQSGAASVIVDDENIRFLNALKQVGIRVRPTTGDENLALEMISGSHINGQDIVCLQFSFSEETAGALRIALNPTQEKMQALLTAQAQTEFRNTALAFTRRMEKNGMSGDEARATIQGILNDIAKQTLAPEA